MAKVDTSGFEPRESSLDPSSLSFLKLLNNAHKSVSLCDEIKITKPVLNVVYVTEKSETKGLFNIIIACSYISIKNYLI